MSIIYNGQTVAGVYAEQILNNADTINAGIIKIATQEEVDAGENNTSAVTPLYLSSKQNKLESGDNISIENDIISCDIKPDVSTIIQNEDGTLTNVGQLTKSGTIKIDWEGTEAEYTRAMLNGEIDPNWYCYITDDESLVDYADVANQSLSNLRPDGEARFDAKANIDLDNLSEVGEDKLNNLVINKANKATTLNGYGITDGLNKNQITNCLLEVPQNIKLELKDGTLTLKAGSKVIVPNGFEANGTTPKFGYVTIASDISVTNTNTGGASFVYYTESYGNPALVFSHIGSTISGESIQANYTIYNTSINKVNYLNTNSEVQDERSLPIAIVQRTGVISSIDQVFNGFGYIGNTLFCDKGVKALAPNGRNADGTLKTIEFITDKVLVYTDTYARTNQNLVLNTSYFGPQVNYSFDAENNCSYNGSNITQYCQVGYLTKTTTAITSFQPKLSFRAVDQSDFNNTPHIIETYINGTSWYRVWSNGWKEQGGVAGFPQYTNNYGLTFTFLKPFSNANYTSIAQMRDGNEYWANVAINVVQSATQLHIAEYADTSNLTIKAHKVNWYACGY